MKDSNKKIYIVAITLLLTVISHSTSANELIFSLINCQNGTKIDCSDCTSNISKDIKVLTNQKQQSILIKEYKNSDLFNSYELKNCRIYDRNNWICHYPKISTDSYSEEMIYKMTDAYIEFKFSSILSSTRLCGAIKK